MVRQFIFSAVAKDPVFEGGSSSITLLENDGWNQQESAFPSGLFSSKACIRSIGVSTDRPGCLDPRLPDKGRC